MTNTGFIIGAYPCAPSFHQKGEQEELAFWRELSDTPVHSRAGTTLP